MQVKDIMSKPVVTCSLEDTLDHAARLMWEFDCGVVPVLDDQGHVAGVLTDRDICMAAYTQGKLLSAIPVRVAMASNVIAVHESDLIEQAEALMREHKIRRLPVFDHEDRPVGLLALNDLARLAARSRRAGVDRELVKTLAALCEPRGATGQS